MFFSQLAAHLNSDFAIPTPGTDLLPNPGFDPNPQQVGHSPTWTMRNKSASPPEYINRGWSFSLYEITANNQRLTAAIEIENVPLGRRMEFCLKAEPAGGSNHILIDVCGYDDNGLAVYRNRQMYTLSPRTSRQIRHQILPTGDVRKLRLSISRGPSSGVRCSKVRLIAGLPTALLPQPALKGAGLLYVTAKTDARPERNSSSGTVTFPIPIQHGSQIPIAFEVTTTPPSALKGYRWEVRGDEKHILCHVAVDTFDEEVRVNWESLVFVEEFGTSSNHQQHEVFQPHQLDPCLASSEMIQANHSQILDQAKRIAEISISTFDYAKRVLRFASSKAIKPKSVPIDAVSGLSARGGVISGACLAAALFRAQGIPARTLAFLPSGPEQNNSEGWLVEWLHPTQGWFRAKLYSESPSSSENSAVVLKVANLKDENMDLIAASESMHALRHARVASTPPMYATCFLSEGLQVVKDEERGLLKYSNSAYPVMQLHQEKLLLDSIRQTSLRAWQTQLQDGRFGLLSNRRNASILLAVQNQNPRQLLTALAS